MSLTLVNDDVVTAEQRKRLVEMAKHGDCSMARACVELGDCSMTKLNELIASGKVLAWRDGREVRVLLASIWEYKAAQVFNAAGVEG